jgi:soluble lytic murein transglycosylase-like protein
MLERSSAGFSRWPGAAGVAALVDREAAATGVSPALVMGMIAVESSFDARAYRAEPQISDASRGLMQILYRTAQSLGYRGTAEGLYDPAVNVRLGVTYLADGIRQYGNVWDAVSRYNQGAPRKNADGTYRNQVYVDRVRQYAGLFGEGAPAATAGAGSWIAVLAIAGAVWARWRKRLT